MDFEQNQEQLEGEENLDDLFEGFEAQPQKKQEINQQKQNIQSQSQNQQQQKQETLNSKRKQQEQDNASYNDSVEKKINKSNNGINMLDKEIQSQNPMEHLENQQFVNNKEHLHTKQSNGVDEELKIQENDQEYNQMESDEELLKECDVHKVDDIKIIHERNEFQNCVHELFYPENYQRKERSTKPKAKEYKFTLDPFQRKALECLEKEESVLVAAHTSAGKTAVAEYAIAMSKRDKQKVIYTSPIKALSNQKYRELQEEFKDVGLVTGDVSLNQNASCLVMTTEILRSMLYRGSEIIREVAWVIFDEVHYMRDKERGVVWEESIILVNQNVKFVFLSATIPNAAEFAEWICKIKKQPCNVVYTEYRPVPLQHYIFPSGGEGVFMVVDEQGTFREDNFQKAVSVLGDNVDLLNMDNKKKRKKPTEGAELTKIVKMIMDKKFDPVIIFSFSKKEVEGYALSMNKMDLTTPEEKENIQDVFTRAIQSLSEEDQQLPFIQHIIPLLKKGIGIHHGGLLPIIKEVIEIMFQEGWIKVLFSTETFSMGLNMPAKTVVFTSVRKWDGETNRWITGGEYIQMSGRAGRRGLDDRGITILIIDEKIDQEVAKSFLKGNSNPLISSFHLNYNMLLNSIRMEDTDPEYIIRRSFHQFQSDHNLPKMQEKYIEIKKQQNQIVIEDQSIIAEIYKVEQQLKMYIQKIKRIVIQPQYICKYLAIGRILKVRHQDKDWGWGISINFTQKKATVSNKKKDNSIQEDKITIVDIMLHIKPRKKNDAPQPALLEEEGDLEVIPMMLDCVEEVSSIKLTLPNNLITRENKYLIKETLKEIKKNFGENIPVLDPIKDMQIDNKDLDSSLQKKQKLLINKSELVAQTTNFEEKMEKYEQKQKYIQSLKLLKKSIQDSQKMVLSDDLKCMKRVMRRLEFLDSNDIVINKGKTACEISACDELLLTELLFKGLFNDLEPAETAAILSALIHDENNSQEKVTIKNESLNKSYLQIIEQAKKIFEIFQESKITIEEKDYLGSIKPHLVDVVYAWCKGASFLEITKMCDVYEGSIIRCMRRLDELLKQLSNASKVIGNENLEKKFDEASKLLKRGIVFSASLYL